MISIYFLIKKNASESNWRQTYSISEGGEDFANRHCYFELIGPNGHFYNEAMRGFVCYWGEYLNYNWHSHEAEEIYYILGGKALFKTKTMTKVLKANETQFHKSWESHAMETLEEPLLAFILCRLKPLSPGIFAKFIVEICCVICRFHVLSMKFHISMKIHISMKFHRF